MLKRLMVAVAAFILAVLGTSGQSTKADGNRRNAVTAQSAPPIVPIKRADSGAQKAESSSNPSHLYDFVKRPDWWLVFAGLATGGVVGWQAFETRRAATATQTSVGLLTRQTILLEQSVAAAQKSAEAADKSAMAAMGVAIPTLMLQEFKFTPIRPVDYTFFQNPTATITVKNCGQSPAFLKAYVIVFTCDELPEEPVYPFPYPCSAEEVIDSGEIEQLDLENVSGEIPLSIAYQLEAGKLTLNAYGYVSYSDIFGSPIRYMKFSKKLLEFDRHSRNTTVLDHGGYKYTGQHQSYDPPRTSPT